MAATITKIAQEAGVSVPLVSRLMRGDPSLRISQSRAEHVKAVANRLGGVKPRKMAPSASVSRAMHVVAPISSIFSLLWAQSSLATTPFIHAAEERLQQEGFRLGFSLFRAENPLPTFLDLMGAREYCDGLLLLSGAADQALAEALLGNRYPHVSADARAEALGLNTVCDDVLGGIRQALDHLASLGHRRIGFFGSLDRHYPSFLSALTERGLPVNDAFNCLFAWPPWPHTVESIRALASRTFSAWLDSRPSATAMVCFNDWGVLGAMDVMDARGLKPGRDLSLVGYDNIEERGPEPSPRPQITTIDHPTDRIGARCAELLVNQILHGQNQIVHEHVPLKLIARETTGPCGSGSNQGAAVRLGTNVTA